MRSIVAKIVVTLLLGASMYAQGQAPNGQPNQPELSAELRLERENMLLTARVAELETQISQLKAILVQDRIGKAAPDLIQRLQAAAPEWDVNPQTLEFTKKQAAVPPPPAPTTAPPAQPRPQ